MKKVMLASVLKPVDDPRMFEKFALSLALDADVAMIGRPNDLPQPLTNITSIPIPLGASRPRAWLHIWRQLNSIRPDVLVIHAVELLPIALLARMMGCRVIYDVQENYLRNIRHQGTYRGINRLLLGHGSRLGEWLSRGWVSHYVLAEQCYQTEMSFHRGRATVLENKYVPLPWQAQGRRVRPWHFVLSGTINKVYGIQEALTFWVKLKEHLPQATLTIIGHLPDPSLKPRIEQVEGIVSLVSPTPVPHSQIISQMLTADACLLPYQPNPSTQDCIPTKLYECLALGIPMIIPPNPLWESICQPHQAAVVIDFEKWDAASFVQALTTKRFYPHGAVEDACWKQEAHLLRALVASLSK